MTAPHARQFFSTVAAASSKRITDLTIKYIIIVYTTVPTPKTSCVFFGVPQHLHNVLVLSLRYYPHTHIPTYYYYYYIVIISQCDCGVFVSTWSIRATDFREMSSSFNIWVLYKAVDPQSRVVVYGDGCRVNHFMQ